ncbi:MAG: Smr/MutS family protein [Thermodesulfobacteriota bacterium]|nr:Smr/MutS family protein [Thermodesulfobacteriota bacterium]
MKKSTGFNTPFEILKGVQITKEQKKKATPEKNQLQRPAVPVDDSDAFKRAMEGVQPLHHDQADPEVGPPQKRYIRDERQEVMQELNALVSGRTQFDITMTGEYIEGHVIPIDPRTLSRLKSGSFAIQDHLDLHGLNLEEASSALNLFIQNTCAMGMRSLLVIHGRGLTSPGAPVLKAGVVKWLTSKGLSRLVLAFCSAKPCDGGTGALYVLLKKRPSKSKWNRPF